MDGKILLFADRYCTGAKITDKIELTIGKDRATGVLENYYRNYKGLKDQKKGSNNAKDRTENA